MINRNPKKLPLPPPTKTMLSVLEAAALSSLGRSTVYELVQSGRLRSKRIGKRYIIKRADLETFMEPDGPMP